ncbi:MAG: TaqI-like C-terminal specificity domain-containing protein [Mariprofundus sp.]|nr:TaqI-like C-terminal specificity domain-containing protein [Mariprofundus sp.]
MALQNGGATYKRMLEMFRAADVRYNSGLFHFDSEKGRAGFPDEITPNLVIDDKTLKSILSSLYYPDSPYEFSVLPSDILGQVYEQFLGKVIRLTAGHRAVVEDKPEVKKAGGVYYTPTYIVDYIVRHTVGQLLEDTISQGVQRTRGMMSRIKTPRQAAKLTICDPACGSGSFLLGAYQYLLDWHLKWYVDNEPEKWFKGRNPNIFQAGKGEWRLTTSERKRILLNNIYGVDIDAQAVEVTKLSLLLKVLENETEDTLGRQMAMFHERALPDLGHNIKCGNSLIGPDFYDQQEFSLMAEEERYRINVFDWQTEFPAIFKAGGFDAIIGNPPYIFTREQISEVEREYFSGNYKLSWEKHNTFMLFMEALLHLLKESGHGGYIVPNSWLTIESGQLLREKYVRRLRLIADLNYPAFNKVSMEPCIFVAHGQDMKTEVNVVRVRTKDEFLSAKTVSLKRSAWNGAGFRILLSDSGGLLEILEKVIKISCPMGAKFDVRTGLQAYEKGKGNPPQIEKDVREHVFDRANCEDENSVRYLAGRDVGRYQLSWSKMWMQYGPWLSQPREIGMFTRPRVLLREITAHPPYCLYATFTSEAFLNNKSILNVLHPSDEEDELKALVCILNSRLLSVFYKNQAVKGARTIFPKVVIKNLREFPYPQKLNAKQTGKLAAFTDTMLILYRQLARAKDGHGKTTIQRQIDATDRQIDRLVYELYGLTDEEIAIVEGAQK